MEQYQLLLVLTLGISSFNGCQAQACGTAEFRPRIVGGSEAAPGTWPWIVSLTYNDSIITCGASLISDLWVLTAAHCMPPGNENLTVHMGRHSVSDLNNTESRSINLTLCHPEYNESNWLVNDICLLKLSAPVVFTDHIQPLCLAAQGSTFPSGFPSWVAGWGVLDESQEQGTPEALQEVMLPIIGINECRCLNTYLYIHEKTICAGYQSGGKDSCQGDSGGPLVLLMSTVWIQIGIVSFGEGCAREDRPGIYTRVSEYQDWIEDVMSDSSPAGFVLFDPPDTDSDVNYVCEIESEYHDMYNSVKDSGARLNTIQLLSLTVFLGLVAHYDLIM